MAQVGKPGGGVSGKPGGGMPGMGGGSPMTAAQTASANATRDQNLYTTVGGLSRPAAPGKAAVRPSGPSGPPAAKTATPPGSKPAALPPNILDPLINSQAPYPTNMRAGQSPPDAAGLPTPGVPEGFAPSATTQLGDYNAAGVWDPTLPKRQHKTRESVSPNSIVRVN